MVRPPVPNCEQMYYNTVAFSHGGVAFDLLLHGGYHAFCDVARHTLLGGWYTEGAATDTQCNVYDSDYNQMVFCFNGFGTKPWSS